MSQVCTIPSLPGRVLLNCVTVKTVYSIFNCSNFTAVQVEASVSRREQLETSLLLPPVQPPPSLWSHPAPPILWVLPVSHWAQSDPTDGPGATECRAAVWAEQISWELGERWGPGSSQQSTDTTGHGGRLGLITSGHIDLPTHLRCLRCSSFNI